MTKRFKPEDYNPDELIPEYDYLETIDKNPGLAEEPERPEEERWIDEYLEYLEDDNEPGC